MTYVQERCVGEKKVGYSKAYYKKDMKMNKKTIDRIIFLTLSALILSSGGCSLFRTLGPAPPEFREDFSLVAPGDFPQKIKQLEDISQHHKSMAVRTRAFFYIALAYMHYNNPSPDYSLALEYLDEYITRDAENIDIDEIVAWKSILQVLNDSVQKYRELEKAYAQLKQEYGAANKNRDSLNKRLKELSQTIEKQKKEIGSLQDTIKKLDALHQEIEKKRRSIKR